MQSELWIAIVAGIGGMLGWGFADLFAKKTIDSIGDVVSLAWAHVFGTFSLCLFFIYEVMVGKSSVIFPDNLGTWFSLAFFGVLQAVVYLLVYKGFGKGQVAVLNPVFASFAGIVAIVSIFFLGEEATFGVLISLFVLFIGVMLMSLDFESVKNKKIDFVHVPGFKEVGWATALAAIWTLGWDKFVNINYSPSYTLFMYAFMTIVIIFFAKYRNIELSIKKTSAWKFLILIGTCEVIAYAAISYGYSASSYTSVIALLSGAFSLPTIIFAHLFLKEKISLLQKLGGFVIIIGIIILSLTR